MAKSLDNLGELQLKVLRTLYSLRQGTVYDVLAALPDTNKPKYTTVLTVLRSLEKRGLLSHTVTEDRRYLYQPVVPPEQLEQGVVHSLLHKVFHDDVLQLFCTLLDTKRLSAAELAEIDRLLKEKQKELGKTGGREK